MREIRAKDVDHVLISRDEYVKLTFDDRGLLVRAEAAAPDREWLLEVDWDEQSARASDISRQPWHHDRQDLGEWARHHLKRMEKAARRATKRMPVCSFCEKGQNEVSKIIAGPDCYICSECIELCHSIVHEEIEPLPDSD